MSLIEKYNEQTARNKSGKLLRQFSKVFWIQKLHFYTVDLNKWKQPTFPKMRQKAVFTIGNENDVIRLTSLKHLEATKYTALYFDKFQAGHKLLLGKHNDEIVFYLWVVYCKKELMGMTLTLNKNQVALERGFTMTEYRGHGYFVFGLMYLFPLLQAEGVNSCLTEISTHNSPMIRTAEKIGFKKTNSYYYWIHTPFNEISIIRSKGIGVYCA